MAQVTSNQQKIKSVASELEGISANMTKQLNALDEHMRGLRGIWKGEAADGYQQSYNKYSQDFMAMAKAIQDAAASLKTTVTTYGKADMQASDAIKSIMGGKR